jgi:signal transduction histidine kinase
LGFESRGKYAPLLEDTIFRRVTAGLPPPPTRITIVQALEGTQDADLVEIEGRLIGSFQRGAEQLLIMEENGTVFNAQLSYGQGSSPFTLPSEGSQLRLTGICLVQDVIEERSAVKPDAFRILLRSPADIAVLRKPPWWTPRLMAFLLPSITALFLGVLGSVIARSRFIQRKQARERAEAEGRILAVMAERSRMAREIHDTLAQGFTAISAQLEILKDKVSESPQAAKHLELARRFVRSSLAEARRSIWEMRSQAVEDADLSTALVNVADQLTAGTTVRSCFRTEGAPCHLPVTVEHNLLRIGQEAITNAVRHAQPKQVSIELRYEAKTMLLRVHDDGCGFDPSRAATAEESGFGLVSMRERVQLLSGQLTVKSELGQGTEIVARVPIERAVTGIRI